MNLQGKINLIKLAKEAIKNAIISMGIIPSGNISTYADAITQIDTVNNTSLTVNPSTTSQTLRPPSEYTGYGVVNVNPVTASIDSNITANNIKTGVEILGVTGEVDELIGQTKTITENGVYTPDSGYTGLTSVTVDTPPGILREVKNGVLQPPTSDFIYSLPEEVTGIGKYGLCDAFPYNFNLKKVDLSNLITILGEKALSEAFYSCTYLTEIDLSSLTTINGTNALYQMCRYCNNITELDLSNLTEILGQGVLTFAFASCNKLKSVDLSSLTRIIGTNALSYTFQHSPLTSIDLSNLTTVGGSSSGYSTSELNYTFEDCDFTSIDLSSLTSILSDSAFNTTFYNCTSLTEVEFTNLSDISGRRCLYSAFRGCSSLKSLSFPALNSNSFGSDTSKFSQMLRAVDGCTVHFPSNLQSVIGSWNDVVTGFYGTNTTVLFDLPATT